PVGLYRAGQWFTTTTTSPSQWNLYERLWAYRRSDRHSSATSPPAPNQWRPCVRYAFPAQMGLGPPRISSSNLCKYCCTVDQNFLCTFDTCLLLYTNAIFC